MSDAESIHDRLGRLIRRQAELTVALLEIEEKRKAIKDELDELEEKTIPDIMDGIGADEFKTKGGLKIVVTKDVVGSFPQDSAKQARAYQWLKDTGNDGLIKREIKIQYDRNSTDFAERVLALLDIPEVREHAVVDHRWNINHQTLAAFLRRELEKGSDVPVKDFGFVEQTRAKLKMPK